MFFLEKCDFNLHVFVNSDVFQSANFLAYGLYCKIIVSSYWGYLQSYESLSGIKHYVQNSEPGLLMLKQSLRINSVGVSFGRNGFLKVRCS